MLLVAVVAAVSSLSPTFSSISDDDIAAPYAELQPAVALAPVKEDNVVPVVGNRAEVPPHEAGLPTTLSDVWGYRPDEPGNSRLPDDKPLGKPDNVLSGVGVLPFADDDDLPVFSDDYSGIDVAAIGDDPTEGPTRF